MRKIALIVNDMGSINVDAEILKKNGSNVAECPMFELQNGCICCTLRDEFIEQVENSGTLSPIIPKYAKTGIPATATAKTKSSLSARATTRNPSERNSNNALTSDK